MSKETLRPRIAWLTVALLWALSGCGYQLTSQGFLTAQNIHSIYVEPFVTRVRDVGLDKELSSALRSELYRRGQIKLAEQPDQADALVTGVIRSFEIQVVSVNRHDEVLQYEATMLVDLTLRRREPNEVLWYGPNTRLAQQFAGSRAAVVTTSSEFRTGGLNVTDVRRLTDIQLTEMQRDMSRTQIIEGFARDIQRRLIEMF